MLRLIWLRTRYGARGGTRIPAASQPTGGASHGARTAATATGAPQATSLSPSGQRGGGLGEVLQTVLVALAVALAVRAWGLEVFVVEGSSMLPTLESGERVIVSKWALNHLVGWQPQRGEIVVLRVPGRQQDFVKRVVAVAGDQVAIREGTLHVNGQPVAEPYVVYRDAWDMPPVTVPPGTIWVLGDNRRASEDSRRLGPIPVASVKGPVILRFWPLARWRLFRTGEGEARPASGRPATGCGPLTAPAPGQWPRPQAGLRCRPPGAPGL